MPQALIQCHIVPLLGEGNHKGLPLHDMTVCRGNPLWLPLRITNNGLHKKNQLGSRVSNVFLLPTFGEFLLPTFGEVLVDNKKTLGGYIYFI